MSIILRRQIWRAGNWYTVKPDQRFKLYTDHGGVLECRPGDMVLYHGCCMRHIQHHDIRGRTDRSLFCREFSYNGLRGWSPDKYLTDTLESQ